MGQASIGGHRVSTGSSGTSSTWRRSCARWLSRDVDGWWDDVPLSTGPLASRIVSCANPEPKGEPTMQLLCSSDTTGPKITTTFTSRTPTASGSTRGRVDDGLEGVADSTRCSPTSSTRPVGGPDRDRDRPRPIHHRDGRGRLSGDRDQPDVDRPIPRAPLDIGSQVGPRRRTDPCRSRSPRRPQPSTPRARQRCSLTRSSTLPEPTRT